MYYRRRDMTKRKIEDVINDFHVGDDKEALDSLKNALDFVAYLRAKNVVLGDSDNNFWDGKYENETVCVINTYVSDEYGICFDTFMAPPHSWTTSYEDEHNKDDAVFPMDEHTKEIVWKNIRPCDPTCGGRCSPGKKLRILGKGFEKVCKCILGIYSLDAETVDCMKKMVDGRISDILTKTKPSY